MRTSQAKPRASWQTVVMLPLPQTKPKPNACLDRAPKTQGV